jgi:hypothetical protein
MNSCIVFSFADMVVKNKAEEVTSPKSIMELPEKLLMSGIHLPGMFISWVSSPRCCAVVLKECVRIWWWCAIMMC